MSKDGGPAFPAVARDGNWQPHCDGMTLRDYFAAAAMQAHIAARVTNGAQCADSSYRYADAMLAERAK